MGLVSIPCSSVILLSAVADWLIALIYKVVTVIKRIRVLVSRPFNRVGVNVDIGLIGLEHLR